MCQPQSMNRCCVIVAMEPELAILKRRYLDGCPADARLPSIEADLDPPLPFEKAVRLQQEFEASLASEWVDLNERQAWCDEEYARMVAEDGRSSRHHETTRRLHEIFGRVIVLPEGVQTTETEALDVRDRRPGLNS